MGLTVSAVAVHSYVDNRHRVFLILPHKRKIIRSLHVSFDGLHRDRPFSLVNHAGISEAPQIKEPRGPVGAAGRENTSIRGERDVVDLLVVRD
jgi:hypothetical protein